MSRPSAQRRMEDDRASYQTISRTRAAAAFPSVIGGPGEDFIGRPIKDWSEAQVALSIALYRVRL